MRGVRSMLDLYNIGGTQWTEIIDMVREARKRSWLQAYGIRGQGYVGLETDATVVHDFQLACVPGLLQTESYMRALFRASRRRPTDAEIERDVKIRMLRQRRLVEGPSLELVAIVDEAALRRPVGGVAVLRHQLQQLVERAALPSVCFQVLPVSLGVHAGTDGSFTVLGFAEPDEPDIAYVEHTVNALHYEKEAEVNACN